MKLNCLKYCILFVPFLTQFPVLAVDISGKGGSSSLSSGRARGKKFNQLLQMQEKIREINIEIHNLMDAILSSENAEERSFQALNLIRYLRYVFDEYKLSQKLEKIEDIAGNEKVSTRVRLAALGVLGEHSIPSTLTRFSLEVIALDKNPKITKEAKTTLNKLKAAYSKTGRKFSDLLAYSHESDNVKEGIALLWVAIYGEELSESSRLLKWFSNDDPHKKQIGLLIFEEVKRKDRMIINRDVKNAALRLKKEAERRGAATDSLKKIALNSSSSFSDSEACGHFFGHGPVVPRVH